MTGNDSRSIHCHWTRRRWTQRLPVLLCGLLLAVYGHAETGMGMTGNSDIRGLGIEADCFMMDRSAASRFPAPAGDALHDGLYANSAKPSLAEPKASLLRFSRIYLESDPCAEFHAVHDTQRPSETYARAAREYPSLHDSLLSTDALLRWNASRMQGKSRDYEPDEQFFYGSSALGQILKMSFKSWWKRDSDNRLQQLSQRAESATKGSANINRDIDVDYSFKFSGDNVELKMEHAF